jgi:DNA-binding SARP family transcriptional activator
MLLIHLLGKVSIQQENSAPTLIVAHKAQELLGYLFAYPSHAHTRRSLTTLLWPELSERQGKKYLRQTLWQLQSNFNRLTIDEDADFLFVDQEWIQINPDAKLLCDIDQLQSVSWALQEVSGECLREEEANRIDAVISLYQGEFLEGCYSDWCAHERDRLRYVYLELLHKLLRYSVQNGLHERGVQYGMKILRFDQAHESTHRWLMRLHCLSGNRTVALRQYDHCVLALKNELDVGPSQKTQLLHEIIQADRYVLPEKANRKMMLPEGNDGEQIEIVLQQLEQLKTQVDALQAQIAHGISEIQTALFDRVTSASVRSDKHQH